MYGIPFRSDARFEMYNSSGYAYNAGSKILYLKMRHKSEYETIRLSLGSAPQEPASVRTAPSVSGSNTNAGAAPSTEAASSNQAAGTTGAVAVPQPENPAQPEDAE